MSWLFSQALAEEYLAGSFTADEPSAQLNVMPTPHKFWRNDKTMESSKLSQFGLTLRLLTDDHGEALLTSFLAASRARTLAQREQEQESTENEAGYGPIWHGSFAKFDRGESRWKTAQCSLLGDSDEFLETWPRWGSMRNGASFLRPIPALTICAKESGFWPTPRANDAEKRGNFDTDNPRNGLAAAAKKYPTPQASDAKDRGNLSNPCVQRRMEIGKQVNLSMCVSSESGQLNPEWVEWLMGWPIGWTALKPLAMDKFHEWKRQHGEFWEREDRL